MQLQKRRGALHKILVPTGVISKNNVDADGIQQEELCEVYLLGTAHVSKDSCEDVKLLMDHVQPDVLFVELCNNRLAVLEDEPPLLNGMWLSEGEHREKRVEIERMQVREKQRCLIREQEIQEVNSSPAPTLRPTGGSPV